MDSATNTLPNDVKSLRQLVRRQQHQLHEHQSLLQQKTRLCEQQQEYLEQRTSQLQTKQAQVQSKQQRIDVLEAMVRLLRHHRFGRSSEQHPGQGELFDEAECLLEPAIGLESDESPEVKDRGVIQATKKRGRKPLPADLPRITQVYDLPENEKHCSCGCALTQMGEQVSEQLDIIPAVIQVIRHVRKQYACKDCEQTIKTAPLPPQPIPKSHASAGLLAHVAIAKYQDALPLYRQEQLFKRIGIEIPRNTLANWMLKTGDLIQPLINLCRDQLLSGPVIQCDETPIQVLKEKGKSPSSKCYMWVQVGGLPDEKVILYDYDPSRSGQVPVRLLQGYQGYLQTDGYEGYNAIASQSGITHLVCWAHARRKFVEAMKCLPKEKQRPSKAMQWIGQLYRIEKQIKEKTVKEKYQIRQQSSVPILNQFKNWLDQALPSVPPQSAQGKALRYVNKYWDKLTIYCTDGCLNIDNNITENSIRPFVIGRKNWLFSDTTKGAKASALIYSLIETAKANQVEPYAYLKVVFEQLPQAETVEDIERLLPWNCNSIVNG